MPSMIQAILAAIREVNRGELTVAEARVRIAEGLAEVATEHG